MSRTFLPKSHFMPWMGGYRPLYRWFQEAEWKLVPGGLSFKTATQAVEAADAYLARGLNIQQPARVEERVVDVGQFQWHEARAARDAALQEETLGAVIDRRGRTVKVERRAKG